jgi:16S rRNA (uracil1498-N3)-methyltransferase
MRRYWVSKDCVRGDAVLLEGEVLHHVRDVCRQHVGSKFEVIVDGGAAHLVEIVAEAKHSSTARILETRLIEPLPDPQIHLALSIPRFNVFEAVVEKAVELGVTAIHPFFSEFSFIRKQEDVWERKLPRFQKIVQSATQQSGRGEFMEILPCLDLAKLIQTFNRDGATAGLFAYEGDGVLSAKEAILQMAENKPKRVWAFVGSEGGFSQKEVELFQSLGLKPVTLGAQVLRVETACVATVAILKYGFDLMR